MEIKEKNISYLLYKQGYRIGTQEVLIEEKCDGKEKFCMELDGINQKMKIEAIIKNHMPIQYRKESVCNGKKESEEIIYLGNQVYRYIYNNKEGIFRIKNAISFYELLLIYPGIEAKNEFDKKGIILISSMQQYKVKYISTEKRGVYKIYMPEKVRVEYDNQGILENSINLNTGVKICRV